jgi:hypothetical protein
MQTNSARVDSAGPSKRPGFLTGSILRIDPNAPLWPANVAAAIMQLELDRSEPELVNDMIEAGLLPPSCRVEIRPIDVYRCRQKWTARTGVPQWPAILRSKHVTIID